jgi:crossover junction endodeoxyribonuclease RuvC
LRALGIDPGLVRTGWAVVEPVGSGSVVLAHGIIAPPASDELPARLADGARQLREVLSAHRPDLVALEEVFTAPRHPRSALLMAHMRGAICLVLEEAGVPILALTATTVKQRLTASGHASKEQVRRMVLRLTGLHPTERMRLDETDAIALALAGLHTRGRAAPIREHGRRALPPHILARIGNLEPTRRRAGL